eukprot:TRINITY_DN32075_c0_g1_i2.p1 TRINITY_DN32075_c0_g1~~TRINITY_DN32075_c0_g1_i2.p1  ORF type:complete len:140 (+),score=10.94 TRINITY_DN32075_c0_g1_i2:3-422(+)
MRDEFRRKQPEKLSDQRIAWWLRNGTVKQVKPENLEGLGGANGRVLVFWGDAQWSRAQLLGEIARGHWGLCTGGAGDLALPPDEIWKGVTPRLVFAPETEMTENFMRRAQQEMAAMRAEREACSLPSPEVDADEDSLSN